ncbi:hypothetical protein BH09MYX1_BH09MYX1_21390 [soil metagenome]
MTYNLRLEGELGFPDAPTARAAFDTMMKDREDNPVLRMATVEGSRIRFAFSGELSYSNASDRVDGAEFGVEKALALAITGAVTFAHEDGLKKTMTALGRPFWQKRWNEGKIGFHEGKPNDLLVAHMAALALAPGSRVLVPLSGKSVDLRWLVAQGHEVVGIEMVINAIGDFFADEGLDHWAHAHKLGASQAFSANGITLVCEDIFKVDVAALGKFDAVYDRAALVALEPSTRAAYVDLCRSLLKDDGRSLLIAFSYAGGGTPLGPPWSIDEATVRALFSAESVAMLSSRSTSVSPRLAAAGVRSVEEAAYVVRRTHDAAR